MTQITGIGFSNFRVFSKPTFFGLAPITIFTGTNSSGKSSVFKALKLLSNNSGNHSELNFAGEGHKLGTFQLARSKGAESDRIRFVLEIDGKNLFIIDYKSTKSEHGYWAGLLVTKDNKLKDSYTKDELLLQLGYDLVHEWDSGIGAYLNYKSVLDSDAFDRNNLEQDCLISAKAILEVLPNLELNNAQKLALQMQQYVFTTSAVRSFDTLIMTRHETKDKSLFDYLTEIKNSYVVKGIESSCEEYFRNSNIDKGLLTLLSNIPTSQLMDKDVVQQLNKNLTTQINSIINLLYSSTNNIIYLDSIRANSQRLYSNQSQGTAFNELLTGLDPVWAKTTNRNHHLLKFADKWLVKFGVGDKLIINRIKGIATEVTIERDGAQVDLIDLGYGVTQFLPMLLTVCAKLEEKQELQVVCIDYFGENSTGKVEDYQPKKLDLIRVKGPLLLIEEPESNLHPKLQSLLADFFIDVAKTFEVTLLIETHSEYLIRRLQVLTAAGEVKPEHSVIYYLDGNLPSDSDKFVRKINIKPDGSLTNDFGPGFIDEATNWKMELMRLKNAQLQNLN